MEKTNASGAATNLKVITIDGINYHMDEAVFDLLMRTAIDRNKYLVNFWVAFIFMLIFSIGFFYLLAN
jgi:hypothetical protein